MDSMKEHIKTLVKLDLAALCMMYGANKFISSVAPAKNIMKPGTGKYFKWKYGDVFYHKTGEGSPLVLLHDVYPSQSGYEWLDVVEALSKDHTVYTVDLPGCGRSAKPKVTYTNYFYVLFLTDFIKKVVKKRTDIIADGYSSSFAIMASRLDDTIIHHIIAVNPYSFGNLAQTETGQSRFGRFILNLPIVGTTVYNMEVSHSNIDYHFTEEYLYNSFRSNNRYVDAFYEGAHYNEGNGKYLLASIKGLYMTVNIRKALRNLGDKVTILYGQGIDYSKNIIAEYTSVNHKIKVYPIQKAKYLPMMECPKEFLAAYRKSEEK